jgi:hypothetical protein
MFWMGDEAGLDPEEMRRRQLAAEMAEQNAPQAPAQTMRNPGMAPEIPDKPSLMPQAPWNPTGPSASQVFTDFGGANRVRLGTPPAGNLARTMAAPPAAAPQPTPDAPVSMQNAAQAIAAGLNPSAYFGMAPMALGAVQPQARILDGFHGDDGMGPVQTPAAAGFTPGAGYAMSIGGKPFQAAAAGDASFGRGVPVPRQWTAEDLEPTSVLGTAGSRFTPSSQGFTMASANLPLFRADMANRAQMTNFAAEMAANANRQAFMGAENDKNRQVQLDIANANVGSRKNQGLAMAADVRLPSTVREQSVRDMEAKGEITKEEGDRLRDGIIFEKAERLGGKKNTKEFFDYVRTNGAGMPGLGQAMAEAGVNPNELWKYGTSSVPFWASANPLGAPSEDDIDYYMKTRASPEERAAYEFARRNVR